MNASMMIFFRNKVSNKTGKKYLLNVLFECLLLNLPTQVTFLCLLCFVGIFIYLVCISEYILIL